MRSAAGAEVNFELEGDGLQVEDPLQTIVWRGKAEYQSFIVRIPVGTDDGHEFIPKVTIYLDGKPVGRVTFSITCASCAKADEVISELRGRDAKRYKNIFFSYSSNDRDKVGVVARSYSLLEQEFFQDIMDLESGERWEGTLFSKIDEADLFILFWSESARQSEYVRKEVEYALDLEKKSGAPDFKPFPLEGPPVPEPWDIIRDRHIGDPIYFKLVEKRRSWFRRLAELF